MEQFEVGTIIKSLAGHDQHNLFILLEQQEEYVYLVDGRCRTIEKPKKKKILHMESTNVVCKEFIEERNKCTLNDSKIRKMLRNAKTLHKCLANE